MENVSHNTSYEECDERDENVLSPNMLEDLSLRETHHQSCVFLCYVIYKVQTGVLQKNRVFDRIKEAARVKEFESMVDQHESNNLQLSESKENEAKSFAWAVRQERQARPKSETSQTIEVESEEEESSVQY